ncbi:hypothetical protein GCM10008927_19090 [Amylibacter ulvae]|uniref:Lipoprotein n=1 Tax=Paramylibacter ulvae TaxID=1651968 RepID=A0ABQ3D184_9RHOB|nr:hypothetical protein [Amylibacter ulvae]GHA53449.1 hypothetical protein GCM10008927_19090 [Amylibacter ulvae]
MRKGTKIGLPSVALCFALFGCTTGGGGSVGVPMNFVPTSEKLLKVQTDFLDDVAEAEIASRMVSLCPDYKFNPDENERVIEKFAIRTSVLEGRDDVPAREYEYFQRGAGSLMKTRHSKQIIAEKLSENLERLGITRENFTQFCTVADEQYAKRTQIGRFLKKK